MAITLFACSLPMSVLAAEAYTPTGPGSWVFFNKDIHLGSSKNIDGITGVINVDEYANTANPSPGAIKLTMAPNASNVWGWPAMTYRYDIAAKDISKLFANAGAYRIHFKYKKDRDVKLGVRWNDIEGAKTDIVSSRGIVSEWTEFSTNMTFDEAPVKSLSIRFSVGKSDSGAALPTGTVTDNGDGTTTTTYSQADMTNVLIDDIWFEYSADGGNTYTEYYPIDNYGFRPTPPDTSAPEEVTITNTKAVNKGVMVYFDASTSEDLASYKVYVNGTYKRVIRKGKNAVFIDGLTNGQEYEIKITAIDTDGNESTGATVKATASHNGFEYAHDGWQCSGSFGRLDYVTKHSGKASLFVSDNVGLTGYSQVLNVKMGTNGLTSGDKVKFKFWLKANNASNIQLCYPEWGGPRFKVDTATYGTTFDWTQFETTEFTVNTASAKPYMHFILDGYTDELWIDDIQMFKLDTATNEYVEITDNAVRGDYNIEAGIDKTAPAEVTEAEAVVDEATGNVNVSYVEPSDVDFVNVNIYVDNESPINVEKGVGTATLTGLAAGNHTIIIKTVDFLGNESAGAELAVSVEDKTTPPEEVTITGTKAVNKGVMVYFNASPSADLASYKAYVDGVEKRVIRKGKKAVFIDGLTNGQEYQIKITAIDTDGNESAGTTVAATPSHNGFEYAHDGWQCAGSYGRLDYVTKHGGKASLFVSDSLGLSSYSQILNVKMGTTGLTSGDKVKFKFWLKANNASNVQMVYPEWGKNDEGTVTNSRWKLDKATYGTTFDWTQFETSEFTVYTANPKPYMHFILDGYTDELWIDDIQMFKLDTATNTYVEITDDAVRGDYNIEAKADSKAPASVTAVAAYDEKDRGTVRVTYTEPEDADFMAVNIYNGSALLKTAAKGTEAVLVENVPVGENTLTLKSVDYAGNEAEGVEVKVTVEALSYVTSDYSITENLLTSAKTANAAASMSVTVTNINEENLTGILICGVYKDDTLVEIFLSEQKDIPVGDPVTLSKDFTVSKFDNEGKYEIKLFLWDALTGLKALKTSKTISE